MFDKQREESRWERFKDWCYDNDFLQRVGATVLILVLIGGFIALLAWAFAPEPGEKISGGVVIDMGRYVPGRSTRQYGCWVKIQADDGTVGTWAISDTTYETIAIGDRVEKTEVKP